MMLYTLLPVLLSSLPSALSLQFPSPLATPTPSLPDGQGFTPKPTNGPRLHVIGNSNELDLRRFRRRQAQSNYPNTCGYVDGNEAYSFTCSGANACAYQSENYAFGCCSGTSTSSDGLVYFTDGCYIDTSTTGCYAYSETELCEGTCTIRAQICTESTEPVCRTVIQNGRNSLDTSNTYTQYDCVPVGGKTLITIEPTYSFSLYQTLEPLMDPSYTYDGTTFIPLSATTASETDSTTSAVPGPTDEPPREGGSNTGAIAGGVVGGLAAVGVLAGLAIWALIRRKQKARREAGAMQEVSHVTYTHEGK